MRINFKSIKNVAEWQSIINTALNYTFLQSWEYGQFQETGKHIVTRYLITSDNKPVLAIQMFLVRAKRGSFLQLRHAPLLLPDFKELEKDAQESIFEEILTHIRLIAVEEKVDIIRVQPILNSDHWLLEILARNKYTRSNVHNIDAEKTLILSLEDSPEDILARMRKQTRYYIRKAAKEGVEVSMHEDLDSLHKFYKIHHDTTVRQQFTSFSLGHYERFFLSLNGTTDGTNTNNNTNNSTNNNTNNNTNNGTSNGTTKARVFLANYKGMHIAGAIIIISNGRAFYSDGGSLTEYAKIPASYLVQWKAINWAIEEGCKDYNFWGGVSPDKENKNYPWYGIDLFKRGFGGERYDFMHAHDLPLTFRARLIRFWEWIERKRRGY